MNRKSSKYIGFYRGKVVQCLTNGFCRIWIPDILDCFDGDINSLPIAEPAQSISGGGNTGNGTYTYPDVGATVWCFFEGGNLERPVYFAISNVRAPEWDDVSIKSKENENKGNDGDTVFPSGTIIKFNNTIISQTSSIDEQTGQPKTDKISITVYPTNEMREMYNQAAHKMSEVDDDAQNKEPPIVAASIELDNIENQLKLSAMNSIVLHAPHILIDTTGFNMVGKDSSLMLMSDAIENVTPNGFFRVLNSKVNIDGGANDIVIKSEGDILELKKVKLKKQESTSIDPSAPVKY